MTNVLIIFSASGIGGAERSLTRMAWMASSGNIQYKVGTLGGGGLWEDWASSLSFCPVKFGKKNSNSHNFIGSIKSIYRLVRYLHIEEVHSVYIIGFRASMLRLLRFYIPKTKLVQGVRWNPASNSKLDRSFRLIERWFGGLIDYYIVNSKIAGETLIKKCNIPSHKVSVIYNGIELPIPAEIPTFSERPMNVVTVAHLNQRKGHLQYLDVILRVIRTVPEAKFYFVGRDDMDGKVQQAIIDKKLSNNVFYLGFKDNIDELLRNARAFVLPSQWDEGCPTSILEAMSQYVPVIAYEIDGIPELIEEGSDGFLIELNNREEMASRIVFLLKNPEKACTMGKNGYAKIKNNFSLDAMVDLHNLTIIKILNGN